MIGIIGAMDCEIEILTEALTERHSDERAGVKFVTGKLEGQDIVIAKSGIGKVNAAATTQAMILLYNPSYIINSGVAGALKAELNFGDVVIGSSAMQHDMNVKALGYKQGEIPQQESLFKADEALVEKARRIFPDFAVGKIASGDLFVSGEAKKTKLEREHDASCAEMEGAAIAHVCQKNGTPFIIFRIISDTVDDEREYEYNEKKFANIISHKIIEFLCSK